MGWMALIALVLIFSIFFNGVFIIKNRQLKREKEEIEKLLQKYEEKK